MELIGKVKNQESFELGDVIYTHGAKYVKQYEGKRTKKVIAAEQSDPVNHTWEPTGHLRYVDRDCKKILQQEFGLKISTGDGVKFANRLLFYKDPDGSWYSVPDIEWIDFFEWRDV